MAGAKTSAAALAEREQCAKFLEKLATKYEQMVAEEHADQPEHASSLAGELRRVARVIRAGIHVKPQ